MILFRGPGGRAHPQMRSITHDRVARGPGAEPPAENVAREARSLLKTLLPSFEGHATSRISHQGIIQQRAVALAHALLLTGRTLRLGSDSQPPLSPSCR